MPDHVFKSPGISQRMHAAEALVFLAEASRRLADSLDHPTTLATVAELATSHLADWCVIDLVDEGANTVQRLAVAHSDPALHERARVLQHLCYPLSPSRSCSEPFLNGEACIYDEVCADVLEALAGEPDHVDVAPKLECVSLMVAPLVARGRSLGAIVFVSASAGWRYVEADLTLAEELAHRAALALDNARMHDEAQVAVRRRDEFLAMLAHELRNPLAAIQNAVDVMRLDGVKGSCQQRVHDVIERQGQHMARLLDDLLDIARVTRGKIELRRRVVDLNGVVHDAIQASRSDIAARHHELTVSMAPEPLWVDADPTRLTQVVVNLLNNAAKYTEPGGQIEIETTSLAEQVCICVRDTGIGISPEDLPSVFDLFVQGESSLARSDGGLGIGLTLVRKLVEMHGGSVSATSAGRNRGSEFLIQLPSAAAPAAAASSPSGSANPARRRVVIVEDNADARDMLQCLLTLEGHEVEVASDGLGGVETILRSQPDLAFIDIGLPGADGYQVAQRVRATESCRGIKLIAVSGYGQAEDMQRALAAGFDQHLVKPVKLETLADLLARP